MERFVYPVKGLSEEAFEKNQVLVETWKARAEYAWDTGVAIGHYLDELKNGRLVGRRCFKCKRILIPPRMFCEQCFRPTDEWVTVKDTGTIKTFSLCYVRWDMVRLKEPEIPAVIDLDGASRGMGIMHKLGEVDPKAVRVGMRVQAVWKPAAEREGSITDIRYFKPIPA
jgi:uncharacterized OB-fold protein